MIRPGGAARTRTRRPFLPGRTAPHRVRAGRTGWSSEGMAFSGGVPPAGRGGAGDPGSGLVGMQAEPAQCVGMDADGEPAVPVAVRADAAGQVAADVARIERHSVDATVAQSSAGGRQRVEAPQVLVGRDRDPVGARCVHGDHDGGRSGGCRGHSNRSIPSGAVGAAAGPLRGRHRLGLRWRRRGCRYRRSRDRLPERIRRIEHTMGGNRGGRPAVPPVQAVVGDVWQRSPTQHGPSS